MPLFSTIYIWKIIQGLAPNFSNPITSAFYARRGRSCVISHVNVGRVSTLAYNRRVEDLPCLPGFNNSLEIVDGGHPVMSWLPIRCS